MGNDGRLLKEKCDVFQALALSIGYWHLKKRKKSIGFDLVSIQCQVHFDLPWIGHFPSLLICHLVA
jgi:hypothetical protein